MTDRQRIQYINSRMYGIKRHGRFIQDLLRETQGIRNESGVIIDTVFIAGKWAYELLPYQDEVKQRYANGRISEESMLKTMNTLLEQYYDQMPDSETPNEFWRE